MPPINSNTTYEGLPQLEKVPTELVGIVTEVEWSRLTYEQRGLLLNINEMPDELSSILPEDVWQKLSVEQKIDILISYKVLPEGVRGSVNVEMGDGVRATAEKVAPDNQVESSKSELSGSVEIEDPIRREFQEIRERITDIESNPSIEQQRGADGEDQDVKEPQVPITSDTGVTFDIPSAPRLTGYQPSPSLLGNIEQDRDGDPQKARTWAANLITKIWQSLTSDQD